LRIASIAAVHAVHLVGHNGFKTTPPLLACKFEEKRWDLLGENLMRSIIPLRHPLKTLTFFLHLGDTNLKNVRNSVPRVLQKFSKYTIQQSLPIWEYVWTTFILYWHHIYLLRCCTSNSCCNYGSLKLIAKSRA